MALEVERITTWTPTVEITIDGNDYYLDCNSGDIYDMETQEVVGKIENGKYTIF
jgi:hypothetical protein